MMNESPTWLSDFQSNVFSQGGEDGVIEKVLATLPTRDRWCVEFGAWDGSHLSNTRNLIERHRYSAVEIEGNTKKFRALRKNYASNKNVIGINAFVGFQGSNGLDRILEGTRVPVDFDFLSIDIDGNDYHVWKATHIYTPKVVCIEFNPTIHTDVDFVQNAGPEIKQGASLSALVRLGKEKGYELICVLPFNAIFVRKEFFGVFRILDNSPYTLRKNVDLVTHIFSGYDGRLFFHGASRLPWHGIQLKESRIQHLPWFLRSHPGNFTVIQRLMFKLFRFFMS